MECSNEQGSIWKGKLFAKSQVTPPPDAQPTGVASEHQSHGYGRGTPPLINLGTRLVIVPYEVAKQPSTTIEVISGNTKSTARGVAVAPSAPAIFSLASTGTGQAAVLNQDNSVNGLSNPAPRGTMVQIFATGEGQTSPPGITGSVTGSNTKSPCASRGGNDWWRKCSRAVRGLSSQRSRWLVSSERRGAAERNA